MTAPKTPPPAPDGPTPRLLTVDEYLAFERGSAIRHEYADGEVFAMSPGVTRPHSRIQGNMFSRLFAAARGTSCRVHGSDVQVRVTPTVYYYPDLTVACGPEPDDPHVEDAPRVLAEVLSPSTRSIDLREKSVNYRKIASLQLLLVVDQDARRVNHYRRDADGRWQLEVVIGQGEIAVPCPASAAGPLVLTLDEIYEGVTLPPPPDPRRVREGTGEYLTGVVSEYGPEFVPDHVPVELMRDACRPGYGAR